MSKDVSDTWPALLVFLTILGSLCAAVLKVSTSTKIFSGPPSEYTVVLVSPVGEKFEKSIMSLTEPKINTSYEGVQVVRYVTPENENESLGVPWGWYVSLEYEKTE